MVPANPRGLTLGTKALISVVVTTFNRERLLLETLGSIRSQEWEGMEIIVVDNCSTDGTESAVTGLNDSRIKYFRNDNGGCIAVNRNFGISMAVGDYLAFCDDDDLWIPGKLTAQARILESNPVVGIVGTNRLLFDGTITHGNGIRHLPKGNIGMGTAIARGNMLALSSVLVRRSAVVEADCFDTDKQLFAVEDYALWLRVVAQGWRIRILAKPFVLYRVHPHQASSRDGRITARKLIRLFGKMRQERHLDIRFYILAVMKSRLRLVVAEISEVLKKVPKLKEIANFIREKGTAPWK